MLTVPEQGRKHLVLATLAKCATVEMSTTQHGLAKSAMSDDDFTNEELLAYIDERLPAGRASLLERQIRQSTPLLQRLVQLVQEVEHGELTLGAMWRRGRWSCPPRAVWAGYLSGRLGDGLSQYLRFHLETAGCRLCEASVRDLDRGGTLEGEDRVQKIFQSSAGALQSRHRPEEEM